MSEEIVFNDQAIDETITKVHTGEIVEGKVFEVKPDLIVVNIGYKYEGIITRDEYSNDANADLTTLVQVGDTIEAKVLKIQDNAVQLSVKRVSRDKADKRVEEAFENKEIITVKVEKATKGGLITSYEGGTKVFVPASLISDTYEKDLSVFQGQEMDVYITEYKPKDRRIIGDHRQIVIAEKKEKAKELLETLKVGDILDGTVKSITSFGAFLDLGGIDGLLHISEMSWGRVDSPKACVKNGQTVRVYIKSMDNGKIALSAKFPDQNPWRNAGEKYIPGTIVTGKVARMTDFGAFIELEPGIDALLHVSQISRKRVKKPSDVLKIGQVIEAKIVDFKEADKKISLSRRDFVDDLVLDAEEAMAEEAAAANDTSESPKAEEAPLPETADKAPAEAAPAAQPAENEAAAAAEPEAPASENAEEPAAEPEENPASEVAEPDPAEKSEAGTADDDVEIKIEEFVTNTSDAASEAAKEATEAAGEIAETAKEAKTDTES